METKLSVGVYFVIGCGSDCDGYNRGYITAFVDEKKAIDYCDSQNEWSDGIRYAITSDMVTVKAYCDCYMKTIPLAVLDEDDVIREHYVDVVYNPLVIQ